MITLTYYPIELHLLLVWVHVLFSFIKKTFNGCFSFCNTFNSHTFHLYTFNVFFFHIVFDRIILIPFFPFVHFSFAYFFSLVYFWFIYVSYAYFHLRIIHTISNNSGVVTRLPETFSKVKIQINPLQPSVAFLYPLKTSEAFWYF